MELELAFIGRNDAGKVTRVFPIGSIQVAKDRIVYLSDKGEILFTQQLEGVKDAQSNGGA